MDKQIKRLTYGDFSSSPAAISGPADWGELGGADSAGALALALPAAGGEFMGVIPAARQISSNRSLESKASFRGAPGQYPLLASVRKG
jgi:hypothetical protein